MKKKILAVILAALLTLSIPSTLVSAYYTLPLDVGNFHRYSGGSTHRSSGGSRSRSSGSSRTRSSSSSKSHSFDLSNPDDVIFIIAIFLIPIIITVVTIKHTNKRKKHSTTSDSYRVPSELMPIDYTDKITDFIKQTDIDFNAEKFISWSKNVFITLQTAWTERDWEKIRAIEKEELFEQHNAQLQEYIRLGRINCIERINVNQAFLHRYVRDENFEHLTVCMEVRMIDYIIDEKSGKLLNGNKTDDIYTTYLLTFIRRKGIKTTIIDGVIANSCPHCGAPVDSASAGRCEFCGSIVHTGEFNWVLSDMQAVYPNFKNDNRGIVLLDENNN